MALWKIDPVHSEINFKVKHLVISTVTGHFNVFDATIDTNKEDFSDLQIKFGADSNSINTNNDQRDGHLTSPDFFDSIKYPKMSFVSRSVKKNSDHELEVKGDLTIRDVTKPVTLEVIYNGIAEGPGGNKIAAFEARTKLNRFDFGLRWNSLTDAGGVMVSNEVKIEILAEFKKEQGGVKSAQHLKLLSDQSQN